MTGTEIGTVTRIGGAIGTTTEIGGAIGTAGTGIGTTLAETDTTVVEDYSSESVQSSSLQLQGVQVIPITGTTAPPGVFGFPVTGNSLAIGDAIGFLDTMTIAKR
jgi:hypothetical protein